jgi:hypothetical protein
MVVGGLFMPREQNIQIALKIHEKAAILVCNIHQNIIVKGLKH